MGLMYNFLFQNYQSHW